MNLDKYKIYSLIFCYIQWIQWLESSPLCGKISEFQFNQPNDAINSIWITLSYGQNKSLDLITDQSTAVGSRAVDLVYSIYVTELSSIILITDLMTIRSPSNARLPTLSISFPGCKVRDGCFEIATGRCERAAVKPV